MGLLVRAGEAPLPAALTPPHLRPQHGEVLPLKIVTYAAVSLSLAALLVALVLLALVRTPRSNLHSVHRNLVGALFLSQLVFVIGVTQTGNPVSPPPSPPPPPLPSVDSRQRCAMESHGWVWFRKMTLAPAGRGEAGGQRSEEQPRCQPEPAGSRAGAGRSGPRGDV